MAAPTEAQPPYKVAHDLLKAHAGDPRELLRRYPHFLATEGVPEFPRAPYLHELFYQYQSKNPPLAVIGGLLTCGASLLQKDAFGYTPLLFCCDVSRESRADILYYLLTHPTYGADARTTVNWADDEGCTPLHAAVMNKGIASVRLLLKHNADLAVRYLNNTSMEEASRSLNCGDIVALLAAAERTQAVLAIGAWRPYRHTQFPHGYQQAMQTLVCLAKARNLAKSTQEMLVPQYPQACLYLLPEELLQYLYTCITQAPVPEQWT